MKHNPIRQVLFPIITAFIWGTSFVSQDVCADVIGPLTFNAARAVVAVVVLSIIIPIFDKLKGARPQLTIEEKKQGRKDLIIGGICCGVALTLATNFQQAGITNDTDAGKAGFITALYIVLVPLFGLFFKRKVSLPVWIAEGLAVISLYLLCIKGDFSISAGDLLVLICAVCYAGHILVIDHFTQFVDGMKLSCVQFMVVSVLSTIGALIFEQPQWSALLSVAMPILYVGVFSSGIAYTLQILAQKDSNPAVVSLLLSLESVFAVISGAIILHHQMSLREYMGCLLMLVAVILAQIPMPEKAKETNA